MSDRAFVRLAAVLRRLAQLVGATRQIEEYPGNADNPHPGATWRPEHLVPLTVSVYLSADGIPVVDVDTHDDEQDLGPSPRVYVNDVLVLGDPADHMTRDDRSDRAGPS